MCDNAYRELICEILKLAVIDSMGKREIRELARYWLESSPHCEFYCMLVGIDRVAMLDRLRRDWWAAIMSRRSEMNYKSVK